MYSKVYSAGLNGLEAQKIIVEADVSGGLPSFQMVGLLASAVKRSQRKSTYFATEFRGDISSETNYGKSFSGRYSVKMAPALICRLPFL